MSDGLVGMSSREIDHVLLRFAFHRVRRNVMGIDMQMVCDF